jgi:WD40 repeat protein
MRLIFGGLSIIFAIGFTCLTKCNAEPVRCEGHEGGVGAVALTPDGKLAVSSGDRLFARVWDTSNGTEIRRLAVFPPDAAYGYISDVAISPDGKLLATAAWRQPIHFWDLATAKREEGSLPVEQTAYSLAFSPDGSKLAVAEYAEVKIWDLHLRKVLYDFQFDQELIGQAWHVAFSPDGTLLAAALHDSGGNFVPKAPKVRVWNVENGAEVFSAWTNKFALESALMVAFSPDNKLIAAAGAALETWDISSQKSVHRITADEIAVFCVAFSPDGKAIATGGSDSDIKLWDVATGELARTLKGHSDSVHDLRFSADGKMLASAGSDKLVLIWTLADH